MARGIDGRDDRSGRNERGDGHSVDPFDFGDAAVDAPAQPAAARAAADPTDRHIGSRIKLRRNLLGLSQEKLGEALSITFQQVQKYERGANRVSAARLRDLSRVLDVPIDFFFDGLEDRARSRGFGFAESQEAFGIATDVMSRRETLDLVGAYWRIADADQRRRVLDLVKSMVG